MQDSDRNNRRLSPAILGIYFIGIGFFIVQFLSLSHPTAGFAWLPRYGAHFHEAKTDAFKETTHLVTSKYGYDGQFYSQMALSPTLREEGIEDALVVFNYRARRILFSWTAFALGLGQPDWVIQAYSIQNAIFWLMLAAALLKWFPPNSWQNAIRYLGTLYAPGMIISATHALLDGPSLFLIVLGALFIEKQRQAIGSFALAMAGLGKETNLLSAVLIPLPQKLRSGSLYRFVGSMAVIAIPIGIWILYVSQLSGNAEGSAGYRNFNYPFPSWFASLWNNLATLKAGGLATWKHTYLLMLVTLMVQAVYFAIRPQPKSMWWRLGATFGCLTLILGDAVWEGHTGAAIRVALPMTLAFNVLLPRTAKALPLLLLVNSLSLSGIAHLVETRVPQPISYLQSANPNANLDPDSFVTPRLRFENGWFGVENSETDYWYWSSGKGIIFYSIYHSDAVPALFEFQFRSLSSRTIDIELNGVPIESYSYTSPNISQGKAARLLLQPGDNEIAFITRSPADSVAGDSRELAFALYNIRFRLEEGPER